MVFLNAPFPGHCLTLPSYIPSTLPVHVEKLAQLEHIYILLVLPTHGSRLQASYSDSSPIQSISSNSSFLEQDLNLSLKPMSHVELQLLQGCQSVSVAQSLVRLSTAKK